MTKNNSRKKILLIGGCGYIGSYLYKKLINEKFKVLVCDNKTRSNPARIPIDFVNYQDIRQKNIKEINSILWFAGHSSVKQSVDDKIGSLKNNCIDLFSLIQKISPKTKLIYASTASLYSKNNSDSLLSNEKSLINIPENNAYDSSKFAFDYIAKNYLNNYYGLRMGTLSGYSKNLRKELIFNAMNISAFETGVINVMNSESIRTILFLEDLWTLVKNLINGNHKSGFYNAGSFTGTIAEIALSIAKTWNSKIQYNGDSETYSFGLDCTKMKLVCGNELVSTSIEENCQKFIKNYQSNEK